MSRTFATANNRLSTAQLVYSFVAKGNTYRSTATAFYDSGQKRYETAYGMPIEQGSEFEVLYVPIKPERNELRLRQPTDRQWANYQIATRPICAAHLPKPLPPDQAAMYCDCLLYYLREAYGVEGLAYLYQQTQSAAQDSLFNQQTFQTFMEKERVRVIATTCWETVVKR